MRKIPLSYEGVSWRGRSKLQAGSESQALWGHSSGCQKGSRLIEHDSFLVLKQCNEYPRTWLTIKTSSLQPECFPGSFSPAENVNQVLSSAPGPSKAWEMGLERATGCDIGYRKWRHSKLSKAGNKVTSKKACSKEQTHTKTWIQN